MITWSQLARMKFCPVLPGSQQCYKLFINYILRLHVKSFILASRDPSFALPGFRFAETKCSFVITSARLSGMKMLINTSSEMYFYGFFQTNVWINFFILKRLHGKISSRQYQKRDPALPRWNFIHVIARYNLWRIYSIVGIPTKQDRISFRPPGLFSHQLEMLLKFGFVVLVLRFIKSPYNTKNS